jgi:hypothetical protein
VSLNDVAQAIGWVGAILLTVGYWLVSTGRVNGDGLSFQWINVLGSLFLGIAAAGGRVWASVALNSLWVGIGVVVLTRLVGRRRRAAAAAPGEASPLA